MNDNDGKIGLRETSALLVITIAVKATDMTPNLQFVSGKSAAWMIPILAALLIAVPVFLFLRIQSVHRLELIDLLYHLMGKPVGFVLSAGLFATTLAATSIDVRSYADLISTMYYPQTPVWVFHILLVAAACYIAGKGLETIGRSSWILFPYIIGANVLLVFLVMAKGISFDYLFPFWGSGIPSISREAFWHSSMYAELIIFLTLALKIKSFSALRKSTWLAWAASALIIAWFYVLYTITFDFATVETILYPYHQMTRYVRIGRFITNLEAFFLIFWIASTFVRFALYLYVLSVLFAHLIRLPLKQGKLLLPLSALAFLIGLFPNNAVELEMLLRERMLSSVSVFMYTLPFLLLIASVIKKRRAAS